MEDWFEKCWKAKPLRAGGNPKYLARKSFEKRVKEGADPEKIFCAVRQWSNWCDQHKKTGTEFVPMFVTWLNGRRYEDDEYNQATVPIDYEAAARAAARLGIEWKH